MAYYGGGGSGYGGFPSGGNAFGGFPGGYNQNPGGIVPNAGVGGSGAVYTLGANLPSVNPNSYGGTVHFGPSVQYGGQGYGQFPAGGGGGAFDPNLGTGGGANFYGGY